MIALLVVAALAIALAFDLRQRRVPNWIVASATLLGLLLHGAHDGLPGIGASVAGLLTGLGIMLPFHLSGGMGAGDVKLAGGLGALTGAYTALFSAAFTLIAGGAIGIGYLAIRGVGGPTLRRYGRMLRYAAAGLRPIYLQPEPGEAVGHRFPYVVAIAAGTVTALWWTGVFDVAFTAEGLS